MHRLTGTAMLAALLLTACGDDPPPPSRLRAVSDACQKIDGKAPAECECRAAVLAENLSRDDYEIYAWYRAHWAGDTLYPEASAQAAKAAVERFNRQPADIAIVALAETTYAEALKTCDSKR